MTSVKCNSVQPDPLTKLEEESADKDGPHVELSKPKLDTLIRHATYDAKVIAEDSNIDNDGKKKSNSLVPLTEIEKLPYLMWWERVALIVLLIAVGPYLVILLIRRTESDNFSIFNPPASVFTPPSQDDQMRVFLERANADTTMTLPQSLVSEGGIKSARLHMFWRPEQNTTESPMMLVNYTVFGLPVEAPWYAPSTEDSMENKLDRLRAMAETVFSENTDTSGPAYITSCSFTNSEMNWKSEGLCFFFSIEDDARRNARHLQYDARLEKSRRQHHVSASLWRAETKLMGLARYFQQPVVFKWWPHRWGKRDQHTVTVMQSLVPTREHLQLLKFHGPSRICD